MATYRSISDTEFSVDAPLTTQLVQAIDENATAIAEGAAGAPAIVSTAVLLETGITAFPAPVAGDVRIYGGILANGVSEVDGAYNDTFGSTHTMLRSGTFRFRIRYGKASNQGLARMKLYKNDAIIHTSGYVGSTTSFTFTLDVQFNANDTWKVLWDEGNVSATGGFVQVAIGCDALAATTISEICRLQIDGTTY